MSNLEYITELLLQKLQSASDSIRMQWNNPSQTRTRHFCVDDLLPADICAAIYDAFPRDGKGFFSRESFREKKKTSADLNSYGQVLGDITYAFQDSRVVDLVASITSLTRIEPDPKLYAGGLSMMFQGDFLNPHIDNSHDGERNRYRRLNLLYYVSPDWKLEDGGNFELWDDTQSVPKTLIARANRLIAMETNRSSWHSVSPVTTDRARCCVSNYYFFRTVAGL